MGERKDNGPPDQTDTRLIPWGKTVPFQVPLDFNWKMRSILLNLCGCSENSKESSALYAQRTFDTK